MILVVFALGRNLGIPLVATAGWRQNLYTPMCAQTFFPTFLGAQTHVSWASHQAI